MSETRISQLASIVATNTAIVDGFLKEKALPTPSFDVDAPLSLAIPPEYPEVEKARRLAIEASIELSELLQGPKALLSPAVNATSLQAIYKYEIASKVPIHGKISYEDLAEKCGLPTLDLRRIIRYAIAHHRVFLEPEIGWVAHSAGSRHLAENSQAHDMCGLSFDECWQATARTVDALQKYGDSEPNHTGHSLWTGSEETLFAWLGKNPSKARRFAGAMGTLAPSGSLLAFLRDSFDWGSLRPGATVVDMGGSAGHISVLLAEAYPQLKFVVQDLPEAQAGAKEKIPPAVADRVELQPHDFFTEQKTHGDVYFFRAVFHDWPDKYCLKILTQLIPAMRRGTWLVIVDSLLPQPGEAGLLDERNNRGFDMLMMTLFNSREREKMDWVNLLKEASPHFNFVSATKPTNGMFGTIVVKWEGP